MLLMISREDPDVAQAVQQLFAAEQIEVLLNTAAVRIEGSRGAFRVLVRTGSQERSVEASQVLVASGRTRNTADLGLELAGVELDARGYIAVNERLETRREEPPARSLRGESRRCSQSP
jgi:pyruvate/2-oxoglutarate dehydrogenase complex dihydrolipoamide dehydrogenase (E3) component